MREQTSVDMSCDSMAAILEQEYETSLKEGLSADEVNRRLAENRLAYLTKEKKRSWLRSIRQECMDPLFFFLLFLSVFTWMTGERACWVTFPALFLVFSLKAGQALRNETFVRERSKLFSPKVQVLRDGVYRYIDVREIVMGDVVRLKKGERTPTLICSLVHPGVVYKKGIIFPEESGKAVVAGTAGSAMFLKKGVFSRVLSGCEGVPLRAGEWLFRQGVIAMNNARLPDDAGGIAIFLDTEYFPSAWKPHGIGELEKLLRQREIPLLFFTDKSRAEAAAVLKPIHLLESDRDIIDVQQFACYRNEAGRRKEEAAASGQGEKWKESLGEDYVRQMKSIRVYAGLDEEAKQTVLKAWRDHYRWIFVLPNRKWNKKAMSGSEQSDGQSAFEETAGNKEGKEKKESGQILWVGLMENGALDRDYYLRGHWCEGFLRLLQGEMRWNTFLSLTRTWEEKVLMALCVFHGSMLLVGIFSKSTAIFPWMMWFSAIVCSGLSVGKELWWLWMRRF